MVQSSVPRPIFGPKGVLVPAESDILAGVLDDFNSAMGGDLNIDSLETPQGQLATSFTAAIGDKNNSFLYYVQGVDPAFADGRMQEGLGRIYFIERDPARSTVVACKLYGAPNTPFTVGIKAKSLNGDVFSCIQAGQIPASGDPFVVLSFAAVEPGPVPCPIGSVTQVFDVVPGWSSITNEAEGVIGNFVESRVTFEDRRSKSVAINALGSIPAIRSSVLSVAGVLDAYVVDNPLGADQTIGGVVLPSHSVYVSITGGDTEAVARAIWRKKSNGCNTSGNTTFVVTDDSYAPPAPSYPISFQRAVATPIKVRVVLQGVTTIPADALDQVRKAIELAFAGEDDGPRARIGVPLFASRFYAPVFALGSWAKVSAIYVDTVTPAANLSVTLPISQSPSVSDTDIELVII